MYAGCYLSLRKFASSYDKSSALPRPLSFAVVTFILGTLIGAERQWRQRSAGLRTTVLVALGSAAFCPHLGVQLAGMAGSTRICAYLVSGMGFLSIIQKDQQHTRPQHRRHVVVLRCGRRLCRLRLSGRGDRADHLRAGRQHAAAALGELHQPDPVRTPVQRSRIHGPCHVPARSGGRCPRSVVGVYLETAHYPVREVEVLTENDDIVELGATLVASSALPRNWTTSSSSSNARLW